MAPTDRFVSTAEFFARYAETDAQGIIHHASYIVWFEEARSHYARARGTDYADLERAGYALSVIEVNVRYVSPARYSELIGARCWVEELKSRTVTFGYEIVNQRTGLVYCTGQTRHICVTLQGKVMTMPLEWRAWMKG